MLLYFGMFSKPHFCITFFATFYTKTVVNLVILTRYVLGLHFGLLFKKASGHPGMHSPNRKHMPADFNKAFQRLRSEDGFLKQKVSVFWLWRGRTQQGCQIFSATTYHGEKKYTK
jgi:hypothetical protein